MIKELGGLVSLDPNLRPELISPDRIRKICEPVLKLADLVLPSGEEVSALEMNELDMAEMGLKDGDEVLARTEEGEVTLRCRRSEALPRGLVFISYGPPANALIGADTGGTGMPKAKGLEVEIEPVRT